MARARNALILALFTGACGSSEMPRQTIAPTTTTTSTTTTTEPPTTTTEPPPTTTTHTHKPRPRPSRSGSAPASARTSHSPVSGDIWAALANCESANNGHSANGLYHGYFQFRLDTWRSVGGEGDPHEHSYEVQKSFAQKLQARSGWGQWPRCTRKLGLR